MIQVEYAPEIGELTGLVWLPHLGNSATLFRWPWDAPDTWLVDCLVTFRVDPPRTDGIVVPVRIPRGSRLDVIQECGRILGAWSPRRVRVCHVSPPMDTETILWVKEFNAKLVRERRAR
jgi:hypothetical protein